MSEYHFAVTRGRLPARTREPTGRWLSWGSIPGLGEPFDRARARAIQEAWRKGGV